MTLYENESIPPKSSMSQEVGKVVWVKWSSSDWWPCIICELPPPRQYHETPATTKRKIFVRYLGEIMEHEWVTIKMILDYQGLEKLRLYIKSEVSSIFFL
jgi:hypothetical protein